MNRGYGAWLMASPGPSCHKVIVMPMRIRHAVLGAKASLSIDGGHDGRAGRFTRHVRPSELPTSVALRWTPTRVAPITLSIQDNDIVMVRRLVALPNGGAFNDIVMAVQCVAGLVEVAALRQNEAGAVATVAYA